MIIGRQKECQKLDELYFSGKAELVAVYGRRRVGKTFLIGEHFKGKITFTHAGLSPMEIREMSGLTPLRKQLKHFYNSLILHGMKKSRCPDNWLDAFLMLELFLKNLEDGKRQIIFLDELPWMDTQKSGFLTAFEAFWNTWGCHQSHLMVIVCGSATSWMLNKLINSHGGLYNRLSCRIRLHPFSLAECESLLQSQNILLSRYDIVQACMAVGGIPYYLSCFSPGLSLAQNMDHLFFEKDAPFRDEYARLFSSIFSKPEEMKEIIEFLSTRNSGYTRNEIAAHTKFSSGGALTDALNSLIESDFIIKYQPFGISGREEHYKLIDPFCQFYLKFVAEREALDDTFWLGNLASQDVVAWRGIAFENVCFNHIQQIKNALGISGVSTKQSAWSKRKDDTEGTQIDLLIIRNDNVVNMCEIKFMNADFTVTCSYERTLRNRQVLLETALKKGFVIHQTLITTYGLKRNQYSSIFSNVITLTDLFS